VDGRPQVPGAAGLIEWFGSWPSFHDAEIVRLELDRRGPSKLQIHTSRMLPTVDEHGYYGSDRHVLVTFVLSEVSNLQLEEFNQQNVISGLELKRCENGFELVLWPCYGISGTVTAKQVAIEFQPLERKQADSP
jgi:hypothetical protein